MKFKYLAVVALGSVCAAGALGAQSPSGEATERLSPLDSNPDCMERNGPACVTFEAPVRRNAVAPATPPATVIETPAPTRLPSGVVVLPPATGSATAPNLPPADQTGDFSAARTPANAPLITTPAAPGVGSATVPNSAPADQTGDFSAGRTRSSSGSVSTPGSNMTGGTTAGSTGTPSTSTGVGSKAGGR